MHDDVALSSSGARLKVHGNARDSCEGCNAPTNPIQKVKLVDANPEESLQTC